MSYAGSTTGSSYDGDTKCSPFQVTWNVRRECGPLDIEGLNDWCQENPSKKDGAHGARDLVVAPELLSKDWRPR